MPRIKSPFFWLSWVFQAFALVASHPHNHAHQAHHQFFQNHTAISQRDSKVPLRILPLGASITWGLLSASGNGYRKPLRDALRSDGWEVDMVGTKTNGDMFDNEVEAHSGDTIDQVKAAAQGSLNYRPNVVLINAGTNDCRLKIDIVNTGQRMRSLINSLFAGDGMEKTTIILSTLIPSTEGNTATYRPTVNMQFRQLIREMQDDGVSIVLADMDPEYPSNGNGWIAFPGDFDHNGVVDSTHPNEQGYAKMAYVWYKAIQEADKKGFLKMPNEMNSTGGSCEKQYGDGVSAGGLTQRGSGEDDGIYYHSGESKGMILSIVSDYDRDQWFFARLFRRDRDDLLGWFQQDDGSVAYGTWRNTGKESEMFVKIADTTVDDNCIQPGVNFIDINADGLDDFVCIGKDGTAYGSINQGDGTNYKPPTFKSIGKIKEPEGYPQARVRLADIDGDGRADYCVIADNGDITCWRNGWIDDVPKYWQALGKRFTGKGFGDVKGVRFEDINGDGRDDWLWLDDVGQTTTYTNSRSCQQGKEGDGLNVAWRQGFAKGAGSGPTHFGMSGYGDEGLRKRIHFARVYGEPQDFGLLGRQDYVFMEHVKEDDKHRFNMRVWKNTGQGSTKLRADGNAYCNMLGHSNGMMDYVWILSKGDMHIYENQGMTTVEDDGPGFWGANYIIFDPFTQAIGKHLDRRDLHLTDWDGDGACDIVWTDPDNDNRVKLWRNRIRETGHFDWEYHSDPAPDLHCPEKRGIGLFDRPVQFADISGNGKGDYICLEKDGRSWGYVHNEVGTWDFVDQYKFSEGKDRANLQWADVDGDGKADMIHTNRFNGDGTVWLNKGRKNIGNSRYEWDPVGVKYQGAVAGSCTYFPDLDGNGRADMHSILYTWYNTAKTWFSRCGRPNRVGDDGVVSDPHLPIMPDGEDEIGDVDGVDDDEDTDGLDDDFLLETMQTMLEDDIKNYTELLADGYDKKYKTYSKAVVEGVPTIIHDFYMDHGIDYFTCIVAEWQPMCAKCELQYGKTSPVCRYCAFFDDIGFLNVSEPCPPDTSLRASTKERPCHQTTYWSFQNEDQNEDKEDQFYADALAETGIPRGRTYLGMYDHQSNKQDCHDYPRCYQYGWEIGVPKISAGYNVDDVVDPKETISELLGKTKDLRKGLEMAIISQRIDARRSWTGSGMVDAVSVPVLMIHQAISSMQQVVDTAGEIDRENRKRQILLFLSAFLFLIPIGGEVIGAINGLASIGRFISLAGEAALVGIDIYSVVDGPSSAPFVIFSYILSAGALNDAVKVNKAAKAKRGMGAKDLAKLGADFERGMTKIDTIMRACKA
ncbi:hypothetical protein PENCOP_c012G03701 [Penicillium coprophilum]|uniref:SGNH hydrolase-type esterase domain-containing protein n=1 Tax=Penicillium coprophilum TaxID=36646 RepID=A0A1V6UC72_9EURO|nr:hypothetical protein PENCOP_c012G03701 [Penicillium coprophilum]